MTSFSDDEKFSSSGKEATMKTYAYELKFSVTTQVTNEKFDLEVIPGPNNTFIVRAYRADSGLVLVENFSNMDIFQSAKRAQKILESRI